MCRLVAYIGRPTLLENVLVKPQNSIVMQSLHARETNLRTNGDGKDLSQLSIVADVLEETIKRVEELIKQYATTGPSYFNICLTDGKRVIATRYCSNKKYKPLSLHYVSGYFLSTEGIWEKEARDPSYVIISSEKLNDLNVGWEEVPVQTMVLVDENRVIGLRSLSVS